jgi:predicted NUDIX family phosphoesterase
MRRRSLLLEIEEVLREVGIPLSAKAISSIIHKRQRAILSGATPWKTVGARLAVELRRNPESTFIRAGRGLYALREWTDATEVIVPPRQINPLDEDILAVPSSVFNDLIASDQPRALIQIPYQRLLQSAFVIRRMAAEESEEWVQIIPSFLIFRNDEILSFKRTRKSPEQRLHDTYSIVFGGHLQAEDNPGLFAGDANHSETFLFRELHEELSFEPNYRRSLYAGVLYLTRTKFERQHAGVVFVIDVTLGTVVQSREPGFHSNLRFVPWDEIDESAVMDDRWSATCIQHLRGHSENE